MTRHRLFTVMILFLAAPALMFAQQAQQPVQPAVPGQEQPGQEAMRVQDLMGMQVASQDQSLQGTGDDFVFSQQGDLTHLVVSFLQQAEVGQRYLVPAEQVSMEEQQIIVQVTEQELAQLDTIEADQLPQELAQEHFLATRLQEYSVTGTDGQELGRIEGAMVNLQQMRLEYMAVSPAGELGLAEQLYAVSPEHIEQIDAQQNRITLSVGRQEFEQLQGFGQEDWPQQADAMGVQQ
jgi:sporulation protein YlmC with PRC-barrel domain